MASKRDLKKWVKYTCCYITGLLIVETSRSGEEKRPVYNNLLNDLFGLYNDIVSRINHTEPGNTKGFYKKLKADFSEGIRTIVGKMDELADEKPE